MRSKRETYLNIRVVNKDTKVVFEHVGVPLDHVEMIRMNPNLKVEVIGRRGGRKNDRKTTDR
jgi:hypothetical protein